MVDPVFWLGLSILLVAVSLTAMLTAALPALKELGRAARSAEKLFDTLNRELPPTLESIRLTGLEITNLTDDVGDGVQSAGRVVQQIDQSITGLKKQASSAQASTRNFMVGLKAAWKSLRRGSPSPQRTPDRLPPGNRSSFPLEEGYIDSHDPPRYPANSYPVEPHLTPSNFDHPEDDPSAMDGRVPEGGSFLPVEPPLSPRKQPPVVYSEYDDDDDS